MNRKFKNTALCYVFAVTFVKNVLTVVLVYLLYNNNVIILLICFGIICQVGLCK